MVCAFKLGFYNTTKNAHRDSSRLRRNYNIVDRISSFNYQHIDSHIHIILHIIHDPRHQFTEKRPSGYGQVRTYFVSCALVYDNAYDQYIYIYVLLSPEMSDTTRKRRHQLEYEYF